MLTMITGTPGAGKSLYTVWEIARKVPGSTLEVDGEAVPRRLLSNIKNLLLEHETIGADELNTWHQWAKPGDVIIFDEVQEVWRPRGMGSKVPDCIAALETHRHKGVDIVLVTQHPLLCDPNIRRLINQHLHLRRVTKKMAMVYEWDHCSNISSLKTAIQSRLWHHPSAAYSLYKSAQAHTKPTQRLPRVFYLGLVALAGAAFLVPNAIGRLQNSFGMGEKSAVVSPAKNGSSIPPTYSSAPKNPASAPPTYSSAADQPPPRTVVGDFQAPPRTVVAGCMVSPVKSCECFDTSGQKVDADPDRCESLTARPVFQLGDMRESPRELPPPTDGELDLYRFAGSGARSSRSSF